MKKNTPPAVTAWTNLTSALCHCFLQFPSPYINNLDNSKLKIFGGGKKIEEN